MPQGNQAKGSPIQDYITVAERIEKFYERFPEGRIITAIIEHDPERGFILMRAEVYRAGDDAQAAASGHAYELRNEGYVQKTSYIEVCETSAVGRALALCGFEVKRGIASREEVDKAGRQGAIREAPKPVAKASTNAGPLKLTTAAEPTPASIEPESQTEAVEGAQTARDLLMAKCQESIKALSALGHPRFKQGDDQKARILLHLKDTARVKKFDCDRNSLERVSDLNDAELETYAAVLHRELNNYKDGLASGQ